MFKFLQLYLQYLKCLFLFRTPVLYTLSRQKTTDGTSVFAVDAFFISSRATRNLSIKLNSISFECTQKGILVHKSIPMDDILFIAGE